MQRDALALARRRTGAGSIAGWRARALNGIVVRMLTSADVLRSLQKNLAHRSIGPSTVRGRGRSGVAERARSFLASLRLGRFAAKSESAFRRELDLQTEALRRALPRGAQSFGLARKCLNIFLRDCVDHHRTREHHRLARIEPWLEVPLDGLVAAAIARQPEGSILPRWRTIQSLTPETSALYQRAAAAHARTRGVTRIFLDVLFWHGREDEA